MRPRHARKRDDNEPEIVEAFEALGCSVTRLDGKGVPDLLVGMRGRTWLVEVKCPLGPRGGLPTRNATGGLTEDQVDWWKAWRGEMPIIVRTIAEVEKLIAPAVCGMHGDDCDCADRRAS
jgi:Holliday junction resolvase